MITVAKQNATKCPKCSNILIIWIKPGIQFQSGNRKNILIMNEIGNTNVIRIRYQNEYESTKTEDYSSIIRK